MRLVIVREHFLDLGVEIMIEESNDMMRLFLTDAYLL
jgi:hypothetical protein